MALLEIRNLAVGIKCEKNYINAVNSIDMTINSGEIIGLAGESGCGKTLTALSIVRLLPASAEIVNGTISYNGIAIDEVPHGEIAIIFQEPRQSLNPLMRIGSQISEALELQGIDKKTAREAALDMMQKLKLPEPHLMFNAWPHQLSGGMCQRVMIAIAAIRRPRLLIADEPSSSLDTKNRDNILELLMQINQEFGTAILFITHELSIVQHFCKRLLVMYSGRIIEEGSAKDILSAPMHPYTIALAGAIPRKENIGRPLANIPGTAPSIEDVLPGCPFAPLCNRTSEPCTKNLPPLANIGANRNVCCFFPGDANG